MYLSNHIKVYPVEYKYTMVVLCSETYPANSKYQPYFELYPYDLSDFQKYAIESIVEGNHVLVTAHTGSGKTLPAEFALQHMVEKGKKVIYTSPIKALSNQKYYEFSNKYPNISFGLFTGDIKTNPNADVLIMTTEILMNYLFLDMTKQQEENAQLQFNINIKTELACVVFDEVHYINDADRGQVWEKSILMMPPHVQMVMLSATIDNPEGFAEWCEQHHKESNNKVVYLASTHHRVVPLTHYGYIATTESVYKTIKDKALQQEIRKNANKLIHLKSQNGRFNEDNYNLMTKHTKLFKNHNLLSKRKHVLNSLSKHLFDNEMLPAIAFVFSRKQVEQCAREVTVPLLEFDSKVAYIAKQECDQIIRKLPNYQEYMQLPEYIELVSLLEKGIGIHHSGMIPVLREIVELLISKKYIKMLFATESFAIGLDCPIKTAIFTNLSKFDGHDIRYLHAHEYTQMAGRAGRRGIDTIGNIIHCNNLFDVPPLREYTLMLGGVPQKLVSKYHISYSLILNLIKNGQTNDFELFSERSMIKNEIQKSIKGQEIELQQATESLDRKMKNATLMKTPIDICKQLISLEKERDNAVNKKRKEIDRKRASIVDEYRNIQKDLTLVKEINDMESEVGLITSSLRSSEMYLKTQTNKIVQILSTNNFIVSEDNIHYTFTDAGSIASNIAEIHPLILTQLCESWDYFIGFTPKQLVGLFSCFTDVNVPDDMKTSYPASSDDFLKRKIVQMKQLYEHYDDTEAQHGVHTGIAYHTALNYDIVDIAMQWCDCKSEQECKYFIQTAVSNKSISIGDFTKAMMKIVAIAKEWITVFESIHKIDSLHLLSQIDNMILKFVMTSQSLYV